MDKYLSEKKDAEKVAEGFSYNSGDNEEFLTPGEIRDLIKHNIDKNFNPV